jgi:hypothetical protein
LFPGKEYSVPIAQEAGWAPDSDWIFWKREKSLAPARNQVTEMYLVAMFGIMTGAVASTFSVFQFSCQ